MLHALFAQQDLEHVVDGDNDPEVDDDEADDEDDDDDATNDDDDGPRSHPVSLPNPSLPRFPVSFPCRSLPHPLTSNPDVGRFFSFYCVTRAGRHCGR